MQITHSAYIYTKIRKSGDTVCEVHIGETRLSSRVSQGRTKRSMFKETRFQDLAIDFTRRSNI